MPDGTALVVGATTAVATAAALAAARPVLRARRVLDVPNHRSAHTTPTLRGAGIGVAAGVAVGTAVAVALAGTPHDRAGLALAGLVVLAAAVLGAREDLAGLGVRDRLALQAVIGAAAGLGLVWWSGAAAWWCLPVLVGTVAYVNVTNFMDGVDAISGLHGVVAGGYVALLGLATTDGVLVALGAVTLAAFATWLPWNLAGGRMFLGDAGSYLLGALVSVAAAVAVLRGVPVWAAAAPAAVYVVDAGWTLVRRALRGERWYEAHRSHVYQQLVAHGWSHVGVATLVATLGAACGAAALAALRGALPAAAAGVLVTAVLVAYLAAPRLVAPRTPQQVPAPTAGRTPPA